MNTPSAQAFTDPTLKQAHNWLREKKPMEAKRHLLALQTRYHDKHPFAGRYQLILARASEMLGEMQAGEEHSKLAIKIGRGHDPLIEAEGLELLGKVVYRQGQSEIGARQFERAIAKYHSALNQVEQRHLPEATTLAYEGLARTYTGLTYARLAMGDQQQALLSLKEAIVAAKASKDSVLLAHTLNAAAYIYQKRATSLHPHFVDRYGITALDPFPDPEYLKLLHAGRDYCAEAAQLARDAQDEYQALLCESNAGSFDNLTGKAHLGLAKHRALSNHCRLVRDKTMLASALQMEAWSLRLLGLYTEAESALQEAMAISLELKSEELLLYLHYDLSVVYERLGNTHLALHHIREFVKRRPVSESTSRHEKTLAAKQKDHTLDRLLVSSGVSNKHLPLVSQVHHEPSNLNKAEHYIQSNVQRRITVTELAEYLGISVRNVQLLFEKYRQSTPLAYIANKRLLAAKQAIEEGRCKNLTVAQVAHQFAFENPSRFAKAFKTLFGVNPSELL